VDPVLGVTFSVLRDKKKPKLDFLTGLVKPFEFDLKNTTADDVDINYLKYLAENIITLDLCTTEEVLCMIYVMDRTLMTLGADLLSYVHFLKRQDIISVKEDTEHDKEMDSDLVVASKLALAMCILLYVKNLLVELYDIPDE
jgi:cohesin loading factor subunit SCC2